MFGKETKIIMKPQGPISFGLIFSAYEISDEELRKVLRDEAKVILNRGLTLRRRSPSRLLECSHADICLKKFANESISHFFKLENLAFRRKVLPRRLFL